MVVEFVVGVMFFGRWSKWLEMAIHLLVVFVVWWVVRGY